MKKGNKPHLDARHQNLPNGTEKLKGRGLVSRPKANRPSGNLGFLEKVPLKRN
jgi:hypothetical protein